MNSITALITFVSISGVLNALMGLYAATTKTHFSGNRAFIGVSATATLYIFGFAMELASSTLSEVQLWTLVEYMGIAFCPPFSLLLVMHYTAMEKWLNRKVSLALFVIPMVSLALIATNDQHHLFYRSIYWREGSPFPTTDVVMGEWYIIQGGYTFGCLLLAALILMRQWRKTPVYRKQVMAMLIGNLLPIVTSFLYLVGLTPYGIDAVPFVLAVTSASYIWAIRSTGMLDIAPIAREYIFESMRDGVIVLDPLDRLVDYNRAAQRIIPVLCTPHLGLTLDKLQALETGGKNLLSCLNPSELEGGQRIRWEQADGVQHYDVYISPVLNRTGTMVGRMFTLFDVTETAFGEERLRYLATHDGLTQILSRTFFLEQADQLHRICLQEGKDFSLVLLDVDHFKQVNDRFGHFAGDRALTHVVRVCERHLGDGALFARYGGEEFVAALPGMNLATAFKLAEAIRKDLEESPLPWNETLIPVTGSFGVAMAHSDMDTLSDLLHMADKALYQAKEGGRNCIRTAVT
ncbi:histidine kinase N-terminal 7TM domain-containing diguanylate cyclase [Gorillibacterium timonense]|uniref:histidine kinase N-terminal 7TM domain-containing diguanylate cyclase n=1 Tax=Gorillibacterium timonense TaxID=1689269 RepID=UPI00071C2C7D|nr:histidine kinase N-terminal 7TM domain-containing protein [Gorillibacterium timonense]